MGVIVGRPTIATVSMTSANTEYSYTFPAGTKRFMIGLRGYANMKIAFTEGESGSTYRTIKTGSVYYEDSAKVGGSTIYFQSPNASQTAEIQIWK